MHLSWSLTLQQLRDEKHRGKMRSYPSRKTQCRIPKQRGFPLGRVLESVGCVTEETHLHESHFNEMCGGERRKGSDGRVCNSEAEADGVSPSREERREIHVLFIRAGINGGNRNKVWEESGAHLADVLQGVILISCLL